MGEEVNTGLSTIDLVRLVATFGAMIIYVIVYRAKNAKKRRASNPTALMKYREKRARQLSVLRNIAFISSDVKTLERMYSVYYANPLEIAEHVVDNLLSTIAVFYLILLGALFVTRQVLYVGIIAILAHLGYHFVLQAKLSKLQAEVQVALESYITQFRQSFLKVGRIPVALKEAAHDHILDQVIVRMSEAILPNRFNEFQSFCSTASGSIKEFATLLQVKTTGSMPDAHFEECLLLLQRDVHAAAEDHKDRAKAFKWKPLIGLLIIPVMVLAEAFLRGTLSSTDVYFKGLYGAIVHPSLIVASGVIFVLGMSKRNPGQQTYVETSGVIHALRNIPFIDSVAIGLAPKNHKEYDRLSAKLRDAGYADSVEDFSLKKVLYSMGLAAVALTAIIFGVQSVHQSMINNYETLTVAPMTLTEGQEVEKNKLDHHLFVELSREERLALFDKTQDDKENKYVALKPVVKQYIHNISDVNLNAVCQTLDAKNTTLEGTELKFWYFFIVVAFGVVGWLAPGKLLSQRIKFVQAARKEEVSCIENLVVSLSASNPGIATVLQYMLAVSVFLRPLVQKAIVRYAISPRLAIEDLAAEVDDPTLTAILQRLLVCSKVSFSRAFADIKVQREQSINAAEKVRREVFAKDSSTVGMISFAGLMAAIILCYVAPVYLSGMASVH